MSTAVKKKSHTKTLCILLAVILAVLAVDGVSAAWRSKPESIISYETTNNQISPSGMPYISAHRSGGGIAPEESMMAFKNCIENDAFNVDIFEFDLHITKDENLILLHDDTLDRTTDSEEIFGVKKARPENYTYDELRQLNIGAHFVNNDGEAPYQNLHGADVPDDLKIVKLDDILDYLIANGDFNYVIEIKNGGELGKKGVDILCEKLRERHLLDKVVFGTFKEEVSLYVDEAHPELMRSATIKEVLRFYSAAMLNKKNFSAKYVSLVIPFNMPYRMIVNLGTARIINYAHKNNIAVQYWTINKTSELKYLSSVSADCIMSDYPDELYRVLHENDK